MVEICVHMDCAGCETEIKKALQKLPGVDDVDVDMGMQKVTVMGWADQNKILRTVRKMGKRAELWSYPYNPEYHGFIRQYSNSIISGNYETSYNYESKFYNPLTSSSAMPTANSKASSYNYYNHGYNNGDDFGYYQQSIGSSIVNDKAVTLFNDDNPHACSIM
ncbi:heavy metal-associated isoprenylated plant protein 28-like [Neltuma alba]|uniref:heavy metal-associated isoprenylated plant protein 28-like n=1 Tax=Neltuma alba TaxID=207710 RepID=UPI0010A5904B|nr:heavy metal-associated isoprenylated plant protein 28-like [Prosopis alba]XP_028794799.1 heavy metal-associated isoprenylated plant protein 28-like [Prosopis alba]